MALIRVAQYNSTPTVVADYQAQNAHLQAFTNQLMTQQFILDSGTAQPVIKQGCYVSHGGSLYIADADTSITGSPSDGSVYIRVNGTTSLTVEFVTDISGYTWNPAYTALTSGSYTLLPYLIVKAGTSWTRYNFNPNNQQFGSLASLAVTGNTTIGGTLGVTGAISGASVGVSGAITALEAITTNGPNKPVDNNDDSMPSVGIGGFSHAVASRSSPGYPEITIGSGGTWVYIANAVRADGSIAPVTKVGRISGGSIVHGDVAYTSNSGTVYMHVIAWRIA